MSENHESIAGIETSCIEARKAQRQLYEKANQLFLDQLEVYVEEESFPLPYDLCEEICSVPWHLPGMEISISGDIREAINQLHSWHEHMVSWSIWIETIKNFEHNDAWSLRNMYVEPIAFFCMFQPSATRERFGSIATNAIHQANLHLTRDYKDRLDQDSHRHLRKC